MLSNYKKSLLGTLGLGLLTVMSGIGCGGPKDDIGQDTAKITSRGIEVNGCVAQEVFDIQSNRAIDFVAIDRSDLQNARMELSTVDDQGQETRVDRNAQIAEANMQSIILASTHNLTAQQRASHNASQNASQSSQTSNTETSSSSSSSQTNSNSSVNMGDHTAMHSDQHNDSHSDQSMQAQGSSSSRNSQNSNSSSSSDFRNGGLNGGIIGSVGSLNSQNSQNSQNARNSQNSQSRNGSSSQNSASNTTSDHTTDNTSMANQSAQNTSTNQASKTSTGSTMGSSSSAVNDMNDSQSNQADTADNRDERQNSASRNEALVFSDLQSLKSTHLVLRVEMQANQNQQQSLMSVFAGRDQSVRGQQDFPASFPACGQAGAATPIETPAQPRVTQR